MERIEIPLSKKKIVLAFVGSLMFVAAGLYLFFVIADMPNSRYPSLAVKITGVLGVLFFGATAAYTFVKFFDRKPGFIVDSRGISDNSNAASVGFIPWDDITRFKTADVAPTGYLLICVSDPEKYLAGAKGLARRLMAGNMKIYGTPATATVASLGCDMAALVTAIDAGYRRYGKGNAEEYGR